MSISSEKNLQPAHPETLERSGSRLSEPSPSLPTELSKPSDSLTLYPAIDLLDGKVVRLRQGKRDEVTVYGDDVAAFAQQWLEQGASWLHVVDLNAAFDGSTARQLDAIARIVAAAPGVPIQLGGGLRDLSDIAAALDAGVSRVFLGTVAVENPSLVVEAIERFGADAIAVAVDEKNGRVRTRGWVSDAGLDAAEFAKKLSEDGVRWILHSAIHRDGTLQGPDLDALERVGDAVAPFGTRLICAGGVGSAGDLQKLRERSIAAVEGAVAGRALYEDHLSIADALQALASKTV